MKVAVIQANAQRDKEKNIQKALAMVERAIRKGAKLIALPEAFNFRGALKRGGLSLISENIPGESTEPFFVLAKRKKVFLVLGSVCERSGKGKKSYNTSVLVNDKGKLCAKYRKIHLFDAVIGKKRAKESSYLLAGAKTVTANIKDFKAGLSICYDLRFPEMYRKYFKQGCNVLFVPSSFTQKTGQAHWETLLRARAIENTSYVLAPNQIGKDGKGIPSYGNSMIIGPWGNIIARASGNKEEIVYGHISQNEIRRARGILPGLKKQRIER